MAKTDIKNEDVMLCTGVRLSESFYEKKENRLFVILLKGFIVYLVSMGSIGFYLSAFDIEYNELLCHIVIFAFAMLCALLYYRLLVENLGYLLLFTVFAMLVYTFKIVINSGFYAIVNISVEEISGYLGQTYQKLYTEQIENRFLTVTFVVLFIGIVLDILLNVYISRRMQYFTAIFIVMGLNMIPLYVTDEPDNFYVIMFLAGISMAYIYKSGRHYGPQVSIKRNDFVFEKTKKKKIISYKCDIRAMLQAGMYALAFVLVSVNVITAFKPKESFNTGYETNKYKKLTMAAAGTFMLEGFSGFFANSENVGGLQTGKLGNVSAIKLDYETDLVLQYTPYSYDMLYLKSFTASEYAPYANRWIAKGDEEELPSNEAGTLKDYFDADGECSAFGILKIENTDVPGLQQFLPYYAYAVEYENEHDLGTYTVQYYPRLDGNTTLVQTTSASEDDENTAYDESNLYVPEENEQAIIQVINESGLSEDMSLDEKIETLRVYFQDNIPYTIKPGKTPKNEDFVNYFLTENKKGYCSHFASSAALILRYLGVPTRYVEGYAVDYYQMIQGEVVEGESYSDYYQGYSALGETALVEIEVTDADAHAWVEVYDESLGWRVVDVTPSATEEEEYEDFWEAYEKFTEDNPNNILSGGNGNLITNFTIPSSVIKRICYVVMSILGIAFAAFVLLKLITLVMQLVKYRGATINDKLIMKYTARCRRIRHFDKGFAQKKNYREQVEYLGNGSEDIINILERAGFSDKEISNEEYNAVTEWIKGLSIVIKREETINAGK